MSDDLNRPGADERPVEDIDLPLAGGSARRPWTQRLTEFVNRPVMGALAVLVAVAALGLAVYVESRQLNLTDCVREYNDAKAVRDQIINEIATDDRALDVRDRDAAAQVFDATAVAQSAMQEFLLVLPTGDQAKAAQALAAFVRANAELGTVQATAKTVRVENKTVRERHEQERKNNPLPAPPAQRC